MKLRLLLLACLIATPASAAVTRLTVEKATPMAGGYELLEGHFSGALDPNDKHNALVNDIKLAPRNAAGKVEYSATFAIARPTGEISGVLVYDVPNRGKGAATAIGDGHVDVVSGWQGDLDEGPGVQRINAPSAPVTGPAIVRFMNMPAGTTTMPVKGGPQGNQGGRAFDVATASRRATLHRHFRRPAHRAEGSAQQRLGLCRLQRHPVSRQAGSDQALRQGRL